MSEKIKLKNDETVWQYTNHEDLQKQLNLDIFFDMVLCLINTWANQTESFVKTKKKDEILPSVLNNTFVATLNLNAQLVSYAHATLEFPGIFYFGSNVVSQEKNYLGSGLGTLNVLTRHKIWKKDYPHLLPVAQVAAANLKMRQVLIGLGAEEITKPAVIPSDPSKEKVFYKLSKVKLRR